jgi:four helix bundle protein
MIRAGYEKLIAWQRADELAYQVYVSTKSFPKDEVHGMTSQLRRAALSVPTNIVEGYARQGKTEFRRFADIALGSLAESRYLLTFCRRLQYLRPPQQDALESLAEEVGRLLRKLREALNK